MQSWISSVSLCSYYWLITLFVFSYTSLIWGSRTLNFILFSWSLQRWTSITGLLNRVFPVSIDDMCRDSRHDYLLPSRNEKARILLSLQGVGVNYFPPNNRCESLCKLKQPDRSLITVIILRRGNSKTGFDASKRKIKFGVELYMTESKQGPNLWRRKLINYILIPQALCFPSLNK